MQTFYLTNAWQQNDLNDVQTALRNVMPNAKVYGVQSQNAIVMRGTPDELLLAQQLIDDLDKARGEVVVDIAVLEVSKNWEKTLGICSGPAALAWLCSRIARQQQFVHQLEQQLNGTRRQARRRLSPTLYNAGASELDEFCGDRGIGDAEPAADRQQHQGAAEPAHPRHRRAEGDDEDRLANPDRDRVVPDRASATATGQLAGATRSSSTRMWA